MDPTRFDLKWDSAKAKQNLTKHGVSFGQAATVLLDPLAVNLYDDKHSQDEDRWVTLGRSARGTILVVVHTFDENPSGPINVRIISARRATKREQKLYEATS